MRVERQRAPVYVVAFVLATVLSALATPAGATGSNGSSPLPAPTAPAAVTPSTTQVAGPPAACAQQLDTTIGAQSQAANALLAASGAAFAVSGLPPAVIKGAGLLAAGAADQANVIADQQYAATIPNCDAQFIGTVSVTNGGVNVSGNSIFNNDVAFAGNTSVAGTASASMMTASQGISAFGGAITIGDPSLTTYSSGITIGGGAISGAGTGGAQAFTGDVTAVAIGNDAQAAKIGALALGLNADANGIASVAVGDGSAALANTTTAIGPGAFVSAAAGTGSFAGGTSSVLGGTGAVSIGNSNQASGNGAVAIGDPNHATGTGAVAAGANNTATGQGAVAAGNLNTATGQGALALGDQNTATGIASIAEGQGSVASNLRSVALGLSARASGTDSIAVGTLATAAAASSTALGQGAVVVASAVNSTALGAGAVATLPNQMVFGTGGTTYTAPGIDSNLSRARQSGPLGVVTSDANGNLASDNGALYREVADIKSGAAIAMALSDPSLGTGETIGFKVNSSTYDGAYAFGVSGAGVVASDILNDHDRLAVTVAAGWGRSSVMGYGQSQIGGRVGMQWTW